MVRKLDKENNPIDALIDQVEKIKASIRAKVEHPFRVIKRQFGYTNVRYRGLKKNTLQLTTLFALSNLWIGALPIAGGAGMSAPEDSQMAAKAARSASGRPKSKDHQQAKRVASARSGICGLVALTNSSCSGHP